MADRFHIIQDILEAGRAMIRPPSRFEIMATVVLWVVLASGHSARPRGLHVVPQSDTPSWVGGS